MEYKTVKVEKERDKCKIVLKWAVACDIIRKLKWCYYTPDMN